MRNWITIEYAKVKPALAWAKANCPGYITNDYHQLDDGEFTFMAVDFFFTDNEQGRQNMTAFALKWL